MTSVIVFSFPQTINVVMTDRGVENFNMSLEDSDFKIYKGADNPIDFIVRNDDRKPVNLVGKSVVITVLNFFTEELFLKKEAEILDAEQGSFKITFTPEETANWEPSFYKYSLLMNHLEGDSTLLFVDQDHNAAGVFEFIDGVLPDLKDSFRVLGEEFTPVNIAPPTTEPTNFISTALPADALLCQVDGLHTVVVYGTDYAGKFFVEGSLEPTPSPNDQDWFKIHLRSFEQFFELGNKPDPDCTFTGIEAFTFTAMTRWVRFRHIPDMDNTGTIDQVLYRN